MSRWSAPAKKLLSIRHAFRPNPDSIAWTGSEASAGEAPIHRETARFEPGDPQYLVDLAFGCPFCGGQAGIPQLRAARWAFSADAYCRCVTCERTWILQLDTAQTRRLLANIDWESAPPSRPADAPGKEYL